MSQSTPAAPPEPDGRTATAPRFGRSGMIAFLAIVVGFAGVRFAALFNDLWMDEIWTLRAISELKSPWEIFTRYLQANNHPLSSIWIYAMMPATGVDWHIRLFSWFTGAASIVLGALIAADRFRHASPTASSGQIRAAVFFTALLFGSCYFLIVYSSEARGYAPALAFALLAFLALIRGRGGFAWRWIPVYWVSCALALLSHAASAQVILTAVIWSWLQTRDTKLRASESLARMVTWHLVPLACGACYFAAFVRRMGLGGAPELSLRQALGELSAYTFGFPSPQFGWFALPALGIAAFAGLWLVWRRSRADAVFYAVLIFAAPVAGVIAGRLGALFPRYFIFGSAWALLLAGHVVASVWDRGGKARVACVAVAALFVVGNAFHIGDLLRHGRGEYQATLRYIASRTSKPDITLCSDHDNRNLMLIQFHGKRVLTERRILYFPGSRNPNEHPEWLLVHRLDGAPPPDSPLYDERGNVFRFEKKFSHAPLSGWDWFVFRNQAANP